MGYGNSNLEGMRATPDMVEDVTPAEKAAWLAKADLRAEELAEWKNRYFRKRDECDSLRAEVARLRAALAREGREGGAT